MSLECTLRSYARLWIVLDDVKEEVFKHHSRIVGHHVTKLVYLTDDYVPAIVSVITCNACKHRVRMLDELLLKWKSKDTQNEEQGETSKYQETTLACRMFLLLYPFKNTLQAIGDLGMSFLHNHI